MGVTQSTGQGISQGPVLFVAGPTAIGKTELALNLAEKFGCEIIGVDSMQIYRYMDIGTAKPSPSERGRVPHHLIDYVLPDETYSASRFVRDCQEAIRQIRAKGRLPLLVGGTGLYFAALEKGIFNLPAIDPEIRQGLQEELAAGRREVLFQELQACDPASADRIHANDTYRLLRALEIWRAFGKPWSAYLAEHRAQNKPLPLAPILKIGLARDRQELYQRIDQRVEAMTQAGLVDEVQGLLQMGYRKDLPSMQSLGYRHLQHYLDGLCTWERAVELLARDTRRYAKRQLTWFRADPEITWFHPAQEAELWTRVETFLASNNT